MVDWDLPKNCWVVLDTNFLIDFYSKQPFYTDLFEQLRKNQNTLVSIHLVRTEFIRSKNKEVMRAKAEFFDKVVDSLLPLDIEVTKLIQTTIEKYGNDMEGVELADIYLASIIQRYKSTCLLTRNHSDFPRRLFERSNIFSISLEKDIKTYAIYRYRDVQTIVIEDFTEIPF